MTITIERNRDTRAGFFTKIRDQPGLPIFTSSRYQATATEAKATAEKIFGALNWTDGTPGDDLIATAHPEPRGTA